MFLSHAKPDITENNGRYAKGHSTLLSYERAHFRHSCVDLEISFRVLRQSGK
jgi:hypothetical protein